MKKYYEILEVSINASREVIEKAYRVLIKKYHPDLYMGEEKIYAEQKIRDINEAYKILSDEFLREQYDLELQKEIQNNNRYKYENNYEQNKKKKINDQKTEKENIEIKKNNIGTYKGVLDVATTLFKNKPKINIKELKKEDYMAAGITIVIMIVLLGILWFIPATNGFIKSMLPFIN